VLVLAAAFVPLQVSAAEVTKDSLNKLMQLSGLNKQMAEVPGVILAGFEQASRQGSPVQDGEMQEMKETIVSAFQPSVILAAVAAEVRKGVSEADAREMLGWYESELGRKITKAEELASTPAAYEEMQREARSLLADEQRVGYARKIDALAKMTDMTMRLQEYTGVAVFTAVEKTRMPDFPVQLASLKAQWAIQEPRIRESVEQLVTASFVYSYRTIAGGDIEKYIGFMERPVTIRFNESVVRGLERAFNQCTDSMAKGLARVARKYQGNGK
jgi:hypothetical protein